MANLPIPCRDKTGKDLLPLSIARAYALVSAYETVFFSADVKKLKAMAIWIFACDSCSGQEDKCRPEITSFGCLMCLANKDADHEARRIWEALSRERQCLIAELLKEAGYRINLAN